MFLHQRRRGTLKVLVQNAFGKIPIGTHRRSFIKNEGERGNDTTRLAGRGSERLRRQPGGTQQEGPEGGPIRDQEDRGGQRSDNGTLVGGRIRGILPCSIKGDTKSPNRGQTNAPASEKEKQPDPSLPEC